MKMRSILFGAVAGLCLALNAPNINAQIYTYFTNTIVNKPFKPITGGIGLSASDFRVGFTPAIEDHDNGYYRDPLTGSYDVPLGFTNGFEFDGVRYTSVHINVNGFLTFGTNISFLGTDLPQNLFRKDPPNAVIAPYWGDHYYRTNELGFVPSQIIIQQGIDPVTNIKTFTVEWRDLNINYKFDAKNPNDQNNQTSTTATAQASSVGTFQVKLFESPAVGKAKKDDQGDIEFAYSTVGKDQVPGIVKTSGAAVGIESHQKNAGPTSFMNGLYVDDPSALNHISGDVPDSVRNSTRLTSVWAPSRANNNVIKFTAEPKPGIAGWGDGDANLSQLDKHVGSPQNIFVTASDAILIMRAVAKNRPLDSAFFRGGYHGDVNHNGRFWYSTRNYNNTNDTILYRRTDIIRSANEYDDLPPDNNLVDIFFEANEYDAALIKAYLAGKIPTLPWRIDLVIDYGKTGVQAEPATDIIIPEVQSYAKNSYRMPVYLNGRINGPIGITMEVNGQIQGATVVQRNDRDISADYANNKVVIAGSGVFDENEPVAYIEIQTEEPVVKFDNVRFNDNDKKNIEIETVKAVETDMLSQNYPNPFVQFTDIPVTIPVDGYYTLTVYDMMGNTVKTIFTSTLDKGNHTFRWDAKNNQGLTVNAGMYLYRLEGEGLIINKKMTVSR